MTADWPVQISVDELAAWRGGDQAVRIMDVREDWELDICRFPDSLHIPLDQLGVRLADLPRDEPLVVVCHHGMRSAAAVNALRRAGYDQAINLDGGIDAWARDVDPEMRRY